MTDIGTENQQPEKPGVKFHRARTLYAPIRDLIRREYVKDGDDPNEHRRKIRREAKRLIMQKKEFEKDGMTGLLTRTAFDEMFKNELETGKTFGTNSTLIILDANGLKEINDKQGHPAGDELIKKIAEQLLKASRDTDLVGRYGGDEFAVLLTDTDLTDSRIWWERVNKGFVGNGISISAGSREIFAREIGEKTFEEFMKDADEQMYTAKRWHKEHGKNYYTGTGPYG